MSIRHFYERVNRQAIHGPDCSEIDHQEALISWVRDTEELQTDPIKREALHFFHHIPSGGGRGKAKIIRHRGETIRLPPVEAFRMKMAGVVPGISDLRLDYVAHKSAPRQFGKAMRTYYGLVAEMKAGIGRLTTEQKRYQDFMHGQGFMVATWRTWQRGAIDIIAYMHLEKIAPVWVELQSNAVSRFDDPLELLRLEVS